MWTTGATHMIARLTGSTLFANQNLLSIFAFDHRSVSTTNEQTSTDNVEKNWNVITKMRGLRARNPYVLFVKDNYGEISTKFPDLKLVEISKKVAEAWKNLSDEKKETYSQKSRDQKANYEQEKKRLSPGDLQTIDADEKSRRIEHRVKKNMQQLPTKRPRSAYAHYLSSLNRGEADLKDFMRGAAQKWTQMTEQDKQKFEDLHQEEKQKYVKELVAWASANKQTKTAPRRRSSSAVASKVKDDTVKKTRAKSATGKRTVKEKAPGTSKPVVSAAKSRKTKSPKSTSDKETSSSSDDDSSPRIKIVDKIN